MNEGDDEVCWCKHVLAGGLAGIGIFFALHVFFDVQKWETPWVPLAAIGSFLSAAVAVGIAVWGVRAAERTQKREWDRNDQVRSHNQVRTQHAIQAAVSIEMKEICETFDLVRGGLLTQISTLNSSLYRSPMGVDGTTRLRAIVARERIIFDKLVDQIGHLDGELASTVWAFYSQHLYARSFFTRMVDIASDGNQTHLLWTYDVEMSQHSARLWLCWEMFRCRASIDIDAEHDFRQKMIALVPDLENTGGDGEEWADQALDYVGHGD